MIEPSDLKPGQYTIHRNKYSGWWIWVYRTPDGAYKTNEAMTKIGALSTVAKHIRYNKENKMFKGSHR